MSRDGRAPAAELAAAQALLAEGRSAEAEPRLRRLLAVPAVAPAALQLLAALLLRRGAPTEVLALVPHAAGLAWPTALVAAEAARGLDRHAAALDYLVAASTTLAGAADTPAVASARRRTVLLQSDALQQLGRADAAAGLLRDWLAQAPADADALAVLGSLELRRDRLDDARTVLEAALALKPTDPVLRFNLALARERQGALAEAQAGFEAVAAAMPGSASAGPWGRAAGVAARRLDLEGEARAIAALECALVPTDGSPPGASGGGLVEPLLLEFLPVSAAARGAALQRHRQALQAQAASLQRTPAHAGPLPARGASGRPLRVGYLSPDLGAHAVGGLLLPVLAAHDPARVEVRLYATRERQGPIADRFRALAPYTALSTLDAASAVAALRRDRLDLLVDLGGFTEGAMPVLPAARVAPVQLGYLGYIGSVGTAIHDAQLLDAVLAPPAQPFGEPVVRLPGSALPMDRPIEPGDLGAWRQQFALPDGLLFACFNTAHKIDRELLLAWRDILAALPEAHLLLTLEAEPRANVQLHWRAIGGRPAQLLFAERIAPERHLARAACCDLFLDCFRYGAGATGVSALRAGLPLLCRRGQRPLARLGASLVAALGLDDALCVDDTRAYVQRAIELGRDASARQALRTRLLRAMQGDAADPAAFARKLEDAYATAVGDLAAAVTASPPRR